MAPPTGAAAANAVPAMAVLAAATAVPSPHADAAAALAGASAGRGAGGRGRKGPSAAAAPAATAAGSAGSPVAASVIPVSSAARPRGGAAAAQARAAAAAQAAAAAADSRMTPLLSALTSDATGLDGTAAGVKIDQATMALMAALPNPEELILTLSQPDGPTWVQLCRELQARPELRWLPIDDRTVRFLKDVRSLTKREREMYILVLLKEGREEAPLRAPGDTRVRRARYTYSAQPFGLLNRKSFCTLFDIRSKYLRNLQAHLADHNSVIPRTHGNVGRVPNNRKLAKEHVQFAEGWIREFGRRNGHPETVRIRHRVGDKVEIIRRQVLVITTSTSVAQLHKHFREAFTQAFPNATCFGEETFRRILHTVEDVRIRRNAF